MSSDPSSLAQAGAVASTAMEVDPPADSAASAVAAPTAPAQAEATEQVDGNGARLEGEDGAKQSAAEEEDEEEDEEDESDEEEVIPLLAGREKRVNAGNRMQALLDQEVEEDVMFAEDADDQEFTAKDEEDVFDSDFGSTSSGEDADEEDEEAIERAQERAEAKKKNAMKAAQRAARFLPRKMRMAQDAERPSKKRRLSPSADDPATTTLEQDATLASELSQAPLRRTTARATALSYIEAVDTRLAEEHAQRVANPDSGRGKVRAPTPKRLTQAERIAEALETEELNKARLRAFYLAEEERRELERRGGLIRRVINDPKVIWLSRRVDRNQSVQEVGEEDPSVETRPAQATTSTLAPAEHPLDALARQQAQPALSSATQPSAPAVPSTIPTTTPDPPPAPSSIPSTPIPGPSSVPASATTDPLPKPASSFLVPSASPALEGPSPISPVSAAGPSQRVVGPASASDPVPAVPTPSESKDPAPSSTSISVPKVLVDSAKVNGDVSSTAAEDPESRTYLILENLKNPTKTQERGAFFGTHTDWANVQAIPDKLRLVEGRRVASCAITGRPAGYKDPLTGLAYANLEAYRTIKRVLDHRFAWCSEFQCYTGAPVVDDLPDAHDASVTIQGKAKGKGKKALEQSEAPPTPRRLTIFERFAERDAQARRDARASATTGADDFMELDQEGYDEADASMLSAKSTKAKAKGKAKAKARVSIASTAGGATPQRGKR